MKETISLTRKKRAAGKFSADDKVSAIDIQIKLIESKFLPSSAPIQYVYITSDTGELYQGTGSTTPLRPLSDIIFTENGTLPEVGVPNKLYVNFLDEHDTFEFSLWNKNKNEFITVQSGTLFTDQYAVLNQKIEDAMLTEEERAALKLVPDDFEDVFDVPEGEYQSVFYLTHKPIGKIRLYIDGIRHFSTTFEYDKIENKCTWVFTPENGGFDIEDAEVIFEYDYDPAAEAEIETEEPGEGD